MTVLIPGIEARPIEHLRPLLSPQDEMSAAGRVRIPSGGYGWIGG